MVNLDGRRRVSPTKIQNVDFDVFAAEQWVKQEVSSLIET
jgi:hypothetical protein